MHLSLFTFSWIDWFNYVKEPKIEQHYLRTGLFQQEQRHQRTIAIKRHKKSLIKSSSSRSSELFPTSSGCTPIIISSTLISIMQKFYSTNSATPPNPPTTSSSARAVLFLILKVLWSWSKAWKKRKTTFPFPMYA